MFQAKSVRVGNTVMLKGTELSSERVPFEYQEAELSSGGLWPSLTLAYSYHQVLSLNCLKTMSLLRSSLYSSRGGLNKSEWCTTANKLQ